MRFGFRISRGLWVSLPWWLAPLILLVLVAEAVFYVVMLITLAIVALASALVGAIEKRPSSRRG